MRAPRAALVLVVAATWLSLCTPVSARAVENPYVAWYVDGSGFWQSNCTFWAWERWRQVNGEALPRWGNAGEWVGNAAAAGYPISAVPKAGTIVMTWESWLGHVAFVERIDPTDPNRFLISEYGFGDGSEYHERWMTTDGSLQFIYPRAIASSVQGDLSGDGTGGPPAAD